jgi:hypothetical protein
MISTQLAVVIKERVYRLPRMKFASPICNGTQDREEKLFWPYESVAIHCCPISTKLVLIVERVQGVLSMTFESPR